jgi:hypothetical protein
VEFPEGMDELGFVTEQEMHSHHVELGKSMCGNVDAALRFFRTLKETLDKKHWDEKLSIRPVRVLLEKPS